MPPLATAHATLAQLGAGALQGATRLELRHAGLRTLPPKLLAMADTLEVLDLSDNQLTELPPWLAGFSRLHTLFASNNPFTTLPPVLGQLPALDTLGFKANRIETVPPDSLAPTLRWLILTDNRIGALPPTLTACTRLQKLMLAGNRLHTLPAGWQRLQRLELLRLSANQFAHIADALPEDLLALPRLAWLAHAGNPFSAAAEARAAQAATTVPNVPWAALQLQQRLGEGASGHIHAALWQAPGSAAPQPVALKLYKAALTSDGLPGSEVAAALAAGTHPALLGVLGRLGGHPQGLDGLLMPRLGPQWQPLAGPPSMASCSRDVYAPGLQLPGAQALATVQGVAAALAHLHARGLTHGDLYAHNTLVDGQGGVLLSDFGAAACLPTDDPARAAALQALDRRALQVLADELTALCP